MTAVLVDPDALVEPAYFHQPEHVTTIGPEVADLGELCGFTPNPEQRLLLDGAFGFDKRGRLPFEVIGISSRQNLKTGFLILQGLGKAVLLKRPTQIWTAHKDSATDEAFREFEVLIEHSAELSKRIKRVLHGKGDKAIEFTTGARIVFRARTGKGGQSMSADDINLDELFAVEPQHVGSFMPTMSTRPAAQISQFSSAPHAASAYQRSVMARGRAAALGLVEEPRLLYAEWTVLLVVGHNQDGAPIFGPPSCGLPDCDHALERPGCICDQPELVKLANPSMERSHPPSISWEYIQAERRAMAEIIGMYLRERMGIGEAGTGSGAGTAFSPGQWGACAVELEEEPEVSTIGLAVSIDGLWGSIAAVGFGPDGRPRLGATKRERGTSWMAAEARRIQAEWDCDVVLDERCPDAKLAEALETEGVEFAELDLEDVIDACSELRNRVRDRELTHGSFPELDDAAGAANWRYVTDRLVLGRQQSTGDISMLEGATLALGHALKKANDVWEVWT